MRRVTRAAGACMFAGGFTLAGVLALVACSDDDGTRAAPPAIKRDGGRRSVLDGAILLDAAQFHPPGRRDGSAADLDAALALDGSDAASADPLAPLRARGEYLVRHVAGCMECHTPRLPSGAFDERKLLSGVEHFADLEPEDDRRGLIHTRNLTPDERTGLGNWSDAQIKRAFQHGLNDESQVLHWMMPYWIFANMRDEDADAIVAYLRAIPAVVHDVPLNQPNAVDMRKPYVAYVLPSDAAPESTLAPDDAAYESAQRGRYLASSSTPCLLCHSPPAPEDPAVPLDVTRAFSGRRKLMAVKLGSEQEGAPLIESFNLTPHANGIGSWSASDVANLLRTGVAPTGLPVCDPMPSYFGGSFRGMSADDALDLGNYFRSLPPQDSGVIAACCTACHDGSMDGDAGK